MAVELAIHQSPDHVARVGDNVVIDGDPYVIRSVKAQRERGVFLDWGQVVEYNEVVVTIERFDGHPA